MTTDEAFATIRVLHEAIATKDWPTARDAWEQLAPLHPMLFGHNPDLAYLATLLASKDTLIYQHSDSVH